MYKKDYLEWEVSNDFPLEELRSKFERVLPFSYQNDNQYEHASNRLFALLISNAKKNNLVGVKGLSSIRREMGMNELLFDILHVASPLQLIPFDIDFYLNPSEHAESLNQSLINQLSEYFEVPAIVWVVDNIHKPTEITCRIFTRNIQQDMLSIPVIINDKGYFELQLD